MSDLYDCYATLTTPFGVRGPYYGPQGHRGADYDRDAGEPVLAYEHAVTTGSSYSSVLGWYVSARLDDGLYAGWAHLKDPLPAGVEVWPGSLVGRVAGWDDDPGSAWSGPHIHTTLGPSSASVHSGTVYDPAPRIAAALGSSTASDTIRPLEEDDMQVDIVKLDDRPDTWAIAPGFLKHHADPEERRVEAYSIGKAADYARSYSEDDFRRLLKNRGFHQIVGVWGDPAWLDRMPWGGKAYIEPPGTKA